MSTLLAISSFYGCLIVYVGLPLWYWKHGMDQIISVPEFTYSLCKTKIT